MKENDVIVHIITRDKFTAGYINFMKKYFPMYQNYFYTMDNPAYPMALTDEEHVTVVSRLRQFLLDDAIRKRLRAAKLIVISGFWGFERLWMWPQSVWRKVIIQFWGGDFYGLRGRRFRRTWILKWIAFHRCRGYIISDGDYEKFLQIIHVPKPRLLAPVPYDPNKAVDYRMYRKEKHDGALKILVGNSASLENEHIEAYGFLSRFKDENVEIYSSLSYGVPGYREEVIAFGRNVFGEKYHPITDFMEFDQYRRFLSSMDVGVFNNNCQEAVGNITMMMAMGKTLYLREGTAMWNDFQRLGYHLWSTDDMNQTPFDSFDRITAEEKEENLQTFNALKAKDAVYWQHVFDAVD